MPKRLVRLAVLPALLLVLASLGGCVYPYGYYGGYGYGYAPGGYYHPYGGYRPYWR